MPAVTRITKDSAGGTIIGNQATTVFVNGVCICVLGDKVQSHGSPPHSPPPPMVQSSNNVYAHGILICRKGDKAACGHAATGSPDVFANDN